MYAENFSIAQYYLLQGVPTTMTNELYSEGDFKQLTLGNIKDLMTDPAAQLGVV